MMEALRTLADFGWMIVGLTMFIMLPFFLVVGVVSTFQQSKKRREAEKFDEDLKKVLDEPQ